MSSKPTHSKGTKRSKILSASQNNAQTSLSPQQYEDELKKERLSRIKGEDLLSQEHRKVQLRIQALKQDLPHLYGQKFYAWQREFFNSRNKINLLCAANQIGKSTCLIKKNIEWAGNAALWPELWETKPKMFWYFYPSNQVANVEFEKKWVPQYLPRGAMKSDKNYGWDAEYLRGDLEAVHFSSGVSIYVKTYGQKLLNLQTSTVHMISCFTAGHLIITSSGLRKIEDIKVGDLVLGEGGWNTVTQAVIQHAPVSRKELTNGEVLEATDDHPIWTYNRGWVRFSDLTPKDVIASFPGWKLIKKLYGLKVKNTYVGRIVQTIGCAIITGWRAARNTAIYTLIFGNTITSNKSQKDTLYTTKISTHWIILSKIWNYLHGLNTLEFTRKKSGSQPLTEVTPVQGAKKISHLGALRKQLINIVLGNVGGQKIQKLLQVDLPDCALEQRRSYLQEFALAVMRRFSVGRVSLKSTALETVPTEIKAIHTLTVTGSNTYFCQGIQVHNCDEEMQPEFVDELLARLRAVGGYFNQVFTATSGYELWYRAMECIGQEDEAFKTAYKRTVSLYDCGVYEDGTPSPWTPDRMAEAEASCTSKKEVLKRIHGRFVKDEGLRYESFDPDRNTRACEPVASNWKWYCAVDIGSGGKGRSSGAIIFVAVSPDFTRGRVTRSWRGDFEETTATDILRKFRELRGSTALSQAAYDYASREFGLIAARSGEGFVRADKNKNSGESTLNTLFKSGALTIDSGVYHNHKLVSELMSVPGGAEKNRKFKDDLTDALKYCIALIPWDFAKISPGASHIMEENRDEIPQANWSKEEYVAWEIRQRRGEFEPGSGKKDDWSDFERECAEWNDLYGS